MDAGTVLLELDRTEVAPEPLAFAAPRRILVARALTEVRAALL